MGTTPNDYDVAEVTYIGGDDNYDRDRVPITATFGPLTDLQQFDVAVASVTERRGAVYGHPRDDFDRAARIEAVVNECKDPRVRHVLYMLSTKIARLIETPDHLDSWIDIAGYARTGVMCLDKTKA